MRIFLTLFALACVSMTAFGKGRELIPQVYLQSSVKDSDLTKDQSKYIFKLDGIYPLEDGADMLLSVDGRENEEMTINSGQLEFILKPGVHSFQFYYDSEHSEISTGQLEIKPGYRDIYVLTFENMAYPVEVEKPVIYLYPEKETRCHVQLDIHGKNHFFYPAYEGGWSLDAQPNGDLTVNGSTYNYLFWEATRSGYLNQSEISEGFFVEGDHAVSFLEEKLTLAGLNSKEQADFISYWGPRLAKNTLNFIRFEFNEACNQYADLNITPTPDHLYRINMTWSSVDARFDIEDQDIVKMDRSGFHVLEWGGQEVQIKNYLSRVNH